MIKDTNETNKERLKEVVDRLTEENQRHLLGVLQALSFAQDEQGKTEAKGNEELSVYPA